MSLSETAQAQLEAKELESATINTFDELLNALNADLESTLRPLTAAEKLLVKHAHVDSRSFFFANVISDEVLNHIACEVDTK